MKTKGNLRFITQMKENLIQSTKSFPETLLIAYVAVVLIIIINRNEVEMEEPIGRVLLSLFAILPVTAVLSRIEKRYQIKAKLHFGLYLLVVLFDMLFYFMLPDTLNVSFFIRFNVWMLIAISLFFLLPFFFRRENFEVYFLKNVAVFFMTALYVGILILGIYGIIALLEYLFEMSFDSDIYSDISVSVVGFFGVTFFLGKQRTDFSEELPEEKEYPVLFRVLFTGITLPLLLIYSVILHAYFIRILFAGEFPERTLINLLVWYLIASVTLLLLMKPLQDRSRRLKIFLFYYPYILILPSILLGVATWNEIKEYGLRIPLYLNFVLIAFVVLYILLKAIMRKVYGQNILLILLVLLALSFFTPFNAIRLSISSQVQRLEEVLFEAGLVEYGSLSQGKEISYEVRDVIYELAYSLENFEALDQVEYLPEGFKTQDFNDYFTTMGDWKGDYTYFTLFDRKTLLLDTNEVDYVIDFELNREESFVRSEGDYVFTLDTSVLRIERLGEEIALIAIAEELDLLTNKAQETHNAVWINKEFDDLQVEIGILEAYGNRDSGDLELDTFSGIILVRLQSE